MNNQLIINDPTLYPHLIIKEEDSYIKKCLTCLIIPCILLILILLVISLTMISYNDDNSLSE